MIGATITLACDGCQKASVQPVTSVLVTHHPDGTLMVLFACGKCRSAGCRRVAHPAERALALASGCAVRRPGQTGWPPMTLLGVPPDRPGAYPRTAPLARLARLVQRLNKSEGK